MAASAASLATIESLTRGDSYDWPIVIASGGTPIDIRGWTLSMTIKTSAEDSDEDAQVALDYTFPDTADSQAGEGVFSVSATAMNAAVPGVAWMDFQLKIPQPDASYKIRTFALGKIKIIADITRRDPE